MSLRCITIQRVGGVIDFTPCLLLSLILLLLYGPINGVRGGTLQQPATGIEKLGITSINEAVADTFLLDFNQDLVDQILPFDTLYELALKHSPMLRYERANTEAVKAGYQLSKIVIFKNVYPFVNYANGNQSLASTGTLVSDLSQAINGYRYGINLQIPMDELFGRKTKMRQADAAYRASVAKRDVEALNLKRELIRTYQDMLTSQRILKVRYRDEQTSGMALQLAEVELKQGKIEPRELAQISTFYAQAKSATEYQSGEFLKHFYDLQALVGIPIQHMQGTVKIRFTGPESEKKK